MTRRVHLAADALYDRGGTFPFERFLNSGVNYPKTRRNANPVLGNDLFVHFLGHGIIHRGAI